MGEVIDLDAYREKRMETRYHAMSDTELVAEYTRLEHLKSEHLSIALDASYKQSVIEQEAASRGVTSPSRHEGQP